MSASLITFLWFGATILQLSLAYICRRATVHRRHPAFTTFIYFQNFMCIFAACIFNAMPHLYFWTYHISFGLSAALTLMVALECGKQTFGPRMALPRWVPARIATMVASAAGLVTALDLLLAATNGGKVLRAMVTTEQGLDVMALACFVIIVSYSRRLGISGNQRTQKIMAGFVLYLSVDVLAVFVRGSARPAAATLASLLGMGAYCVSLVWWTVGLWAKEELPERPDAHQLQQLNAVFGRLRNGAEILAASTDS